MYVCNEGALNMILYQWLITHFVREERVTLFIICDGIPTFHLLIKECREWP